MSPRVGRAARCRPGRAGPARGWPGSAPPGPGNGPRSACASAHTPATVRGSAFGLLAAVQSLGHLAASLTAGLLWTAAGASWAFAYLTGWMVLAAALLAVTNRRLDPAPEIE